jgi:hypothetical protein
MFVFFVFFVYRAGCIISISESDFKFSGKHLNVINKLSETVGLIFFDFLKFWYWTDRQNSFKKSLKKNKFGENEIWKNCTFVHSFLTLKSSTQRYSVHSVHSVPFFEPNLVNVFFILWFWSRLRSQTKTRIRFVLWKKHKTYRSCLSRCGHPISPKTGSKKLCSQTRKS